MSDDDRKPMVLNKPHGAQSGMIGAPGIRSTVTMAPTFGDGAGVVKSAQISECGLYRYNLQRVWSSGIIPRIYIMLNPSTADADVDDPTIRRCVAFAKRDGFGGVVVLNLFAFRATDPAALKGAADAIGPDNDDAIIAMLCEVPRVYMPTAIIAAWGAHGGLMKRDAAVKGLLRSAGLRASCFGLTKEGHPRHPLYLPADVKPQDFPL